MLFVFYAQPDDAPKDRKQDQLLNIPAQAPDWPGQRPIERLDHVFWTGPAFHVIG